MKAKCIDNTDQSKYLTVDKVYDIIDDVVMDKNSSDYFVVIDNEGKEALYQKSRFVQLLDWSALAEKVQGFLGWADPEPGESNRHDYFGEVRYAVIECGGGNKIGWVRVDSSFPGTYIISEATWDKQKAGINHAVISAVYHKQWYYKQSCNKNKK